MRIGPQPLLDTPTNFVFRLWSWGSERFLTRLLLLFCGASHSILQPHSGANANVPYLTTYSPPLPGHRLPARAHTVRPPGVPTFDVRCSMLDARNSVPGTRHSEIGSPAPPLHNPEQPLRSWSPRPRSVAVCSLQSRSQTCSAHLIILIVLLDGCRLTVPPVSCAASKPESPTSAAISTPRSASTSATPRTASNATKMRTGTALLDSRFSILNPASMCTSSGACTAHALGAEAGESSRVEQVSK
ncbi:hypothetical protein OH76DRAFT_466325 [Lentinus brumalis]|uniref:Uncharacterized protein n=1 Tax=Lentinus brumalis TaxID=2498619 RepID=A0A371DCN2_9APHY|nr:hypothetical protein OH76DRAFT_466325 [Polyporus brumalis]